MTWQPQVSLRKKLTLLNAHIRYWNAVRYYGAKSSACFLLQKIWHISRLWFPCRYHVGEGIWSHVWHSLEIEPSEAQAINIFKMLQDNWSRINFINISSIYQQIDFAPKQLIEFYKRALVLTFSQKITLNFFNCVLPIYGLTLASTVLKSQLASAEQYGYPAFNIYWNLCCCQHKYSIWILAVIHFTFHQHMFCYLCSMTDYIICSFWSPNQRFKFYPTVVCLC